jgi:transcriptional regulator
MPDDEALDVVARRGFGTVVVAGADGFEATPLPWLVRHEPDVRLVGHVAVANPIVAAVGAGTPAVVVFDLVDGYVSPSWYPSKADHGRVVPTWNYVTVHLHGRLVVRRDADWTRRVVTELTDRHERSPGRAPADRPWSVSDAPAAYIDSMLRGIVGVEMVVERVAGKAKLSQNRSDTDATGVQDGLTRSGGSRLAREMAAATAREESR